MKKIAFIFFALICACSESDDGPIPLFPNGILGEREGYLLSASLDSGRSIHLKSDTLAVFLDSIWSLADCYLENIFLEERIEDTILILHPKVEFSISEKDCAAPLYRPDTTLYLLPSSSWKNIREIRIENTDGIPQDTITLRAGKFLSDTFSIYIDTTFSSPYAWPRRTPELPSIMRALDSLEERKFYWRTIPSTCKHIIDTCQTVPDTAFPSNWSLRDTNLVPLRVACEDSTLRYCLLRDWENDSSKAGELRERLDTLWFSSWYLVSSIPKCGTIVDLFRWSVFPGGTFVGMQKAFSPESMSECFLRETDTLAVFHLGTNSLISNADSLLDIFFEAGLGRDTL